MTNLAQSRILSDVAGYYSVRGDVPNEHRIDYVPYTLDILARTGRRGFGFNIPSLSSDPERRRPNLYYANPADMLAYCLRFGRSVAVFQDYGLYEFPLLVRRERLNS